MAYSSHVVDDAGPPGVVTSSLSEDKATTTISVHGNLQGAEHELNRTIKRAVRAEAAIVLDLSDCGYCDSTALGLVVAWQRKLDARFKLVLAATGNVRRIFEITGLSRRLMVSTHP